MELKVFTYPAPRTRKVVEEEKRKKELVELQRKQEALFKNKLKHFDFN